MPLSMEGSLLGLGSVVRLDDASRTGLFVILARGAYRPDAERNDVLARYLVAPHPYGEAPDQETFPILSGEIDAVVFEGYTDEADTAFLADLLHQMEHGRRPSARAEQYTESLTVVPEAPPQTAPDAVSVSADAFAGLRALIGKNLGKDE